MSFPQLLHDEPEIDVDALWSGLHNFAQRLANLLDVLPASSPVLLTGDWGGGKTTLLRALENELNRRVAERVVRFDAWRYEGDVSLLPALMRAVWEATPEAYARNARRSELFRSLWNAALLISLRLLPAAAGALAAGPAGAAGMGVFAQKFGEKVTEDLKPSDIRDDLEALGSVQPAIQDETKQLRRAFAELVEDAWPQTLPVILIDDLDRCSPTAAVHLLDAIRALVTSGPELSCRFVVALDREVVTQAIALKFGGISDYDGNRYLEKIFPLTFAVPTPNESDTAGLIDRFLRVDENPGERDHRDTLALVLARPAFANPRLMKRCVNRYRLVGYFEQQTQGTNPDVRDQSRRDRALAEWLGATERWPVLRRLIQRHDEAYWRVLVDDARDASSQPAELRATQLDLGLRSWLRDTFKNISDALATYQDADRRLRRWGM